MALVEPGAHGGAMTRDGPASDDGPSALRQAQLHLAMAAVCCASGDADRARTEVDAVLEQPGLPASLYEAAGRRRTIALLTNVDQGDLEVDRLMAEVGEDARRGAVADECSPTALVVAAVAAWRHGLVDQTLQLLWAAERRGREPCDDSFPGLGLSVVLTTLGRVEDAYACTAAAADEIRLDGHPLWSAAPALFAARVDLAAGRVDSATTSARTGLDMTCEMSSSSLAPIAWNVLVHAALRRGELGRATELFDEWNATTAPGMLLFGTPHQRWSELRLRDAHGVDLLGDPGTETTYDVVASDRRLLLEEPGAAAWLTRVAVRADDQRRAQVVVQAVEHLAATNPRHRAIVAAAWHARGVAGHDLTALRSAATMHCAPWDRASAAEDAAHVSLARGDRAAARSWLERAVTDYDLGGATHDAARIRSRLRDVGVRVRHWSSQTRPVSGWESLTETESVVTGFVAEGLSNQQVATRMFLSRHTVDFHLRHIFRKLGIDSRVVLTRIALSHEPACS
ncbi:helix-turn-helix transcriptional regulator [Dermatobacter hominis]|uniref:helix-turn-helix transcriptional regulator n=1 Tax=Dermatobacter hominis TaxID=2884263 RepID=UPI001D111424|nr:helix-turn-helix transcriptional regulator [Dermatobacter hominis]UDY37663.1 helix-turn-helix transcriptional regulator [Dermatobacter hominis]